jgi:hypothetical protein
VLLSECDVPCYLQASTLISHVAVCGCLVEVVCEPRSVVDGLVEMRLGVFLFGDLLEIIDDAGQEDALDHVYIFGKDAGGIVNLLDTGIQFGGLDEQLGAETKTLKGYFGHRCIFKHTCSTQKFQEYDGCSLHGRRIGVFGVIGSCLSAMSCLSRIVNMLECLAQVVDS